MNKKCRHILFSIAPTLRELVPLFILVVGFYSTQAQINVDFQFIDEDTKKPILEVDIER